MEWGFIWLMFVLKIPILMLLGIVWWAIKQSDEPVDEKPVRVPRRPHPPRRPRHRRPRGPHGEPALLPAPPRIRPVTAIASRRTHGDRLP